MKMEDKLITEWVYTVIGQVQLHVSKHDQHDLKTLGKYFSLL